MGSDKAVYQKKRKTGQMRKGMEKSEEMNDASCEK